MKIRIWQNEGKTRDSLRLRFLNYVNTVNATGYAHINRLDYDCVFAGEVQAETLDDVFQMFNVNHPAYYIGRSLSVSDVVEVLEGTNSVGAGAYFVDSVGFRNVVFEDRPTQISVPVGNGKAIAAAIGDDHDYKEIYVGVTEGDCWLQDLAIVRNAYETTENLEVKQLDHAEVLVFGDVNDDDFTQRFKIDYYKEDADDDEG